MIFSSITDINGDYLKFNIEGLCSLRKLNLESNRRHISIKNLPLLTNLSLSFPCSDKNFKLIDEDFIFSILNQVPHIQELHLEGKLSYFKLDNLVNLKVLSLSGRIDEEFNFELFKNLCKQLESIKISFYIDEKTLFKLFNRYKFPYLVDLTIESLNIKRLKKEFINRLSKPKRLNINECEIEIIEHDSFLNMQQLTSLNLSNNRIWHIEKNAFSNLKNLQTLDLSYNNFKKFNRNFIGLGNSVELKIEYKDFNS